MASTVTWPETIEAEEVDELIEAYSVILAEQVDPLPAADFSGVASVPPTNLISPLNYVTCDTSCIGGSVKTLYPF